MKSQCLISFGSNLGDRVDLVARAAGMVASDRDVHGFRASRLFETPPIGGPQGQPAFLNAVAAFETTATARQILSLLQRIETELGRQRRQRWDARSIDLDVVLHGGLVGGATGLTVPHPRYTARRFVLEPACDVAAHYRDPRFGWTLRQLADHVEKMPPSMALVGEDRATRQLVCQRLRDEHGICVFDQPPQIGLQPSRTSSPLDRPQVDGTAAESPCSNSRQVSGLILKSGQLNPPDVVDSPAPADMPWVAAEMGAPSSPKSSWPRLLVRMQRTTPETRWPAPHQMWPAGWQWPEYRLEVDDLDWAVSELASALDSMRCPVVPISQDGDWVDR